MPKVSYWTNHQEAKLVELVHQGLNSRKIADEMTKTFCRNFTKSSILAKLWRMRLSLGPNRERQGKEKVVSAIGD